MTSDEAGRDLQSSSNVTSVDTLLEKCHELIGELEAFRQYLAQQKKEHTVELRQFRNSVASELKSLERVSSYSRPNVFTSLTATIAFRSRSYR